MFRCWSLVFSAANRKLLFSFEVRLRIKFLVFIHRQGPGGKGGGGLL